MLTPLYAGLLGLLYALLSGRVMWWRMRSGVLTGDGPGEVGHAMVRAHANFMEFVPLVLVLILVIELGGGDPRWVHGLGLALLVARVLHAVGKSERHLCPSQEVLASCDRKFLEV